MTRGPLPAALSPASVVPLIDTREQFPLELPSLAPPVIATLATGDYSVMGLTNVVAIERKSLDDLLGCIGQERERFDREVQRLLAYPVRALVIESGWQALERGEWRSKVSPQAAIGSCLGWIAAGLPVVMCYDHARAGQYVARLLYTAARRRWREARELAAFVQGEKQPQPPEPEGKQDA